MKTLVYLLYLNSTLKREGHFSNTFDIVHHMDTKNYCPVLLSNAQQGLGSIVFANCGDLVSQLGLLDILNMIL